MVSTSSKIYQPGISSSTVIHVASLTCSPAMSCHSHVSTDISLVFHFLLTYPSLTSHLSLNFLSPAYCSSIALILLFSRSSSSFLSQSLILCSERNIFYIHITIAGFVTGQQTTFQSIFKCIII